MRHVCISPDTGFRGQSFESLSAGTYLKVIVKIREVDEEIYTSLCDAVHCMYNYSNIISVLVIYLSFDLRIRAAEKVVITIWAPLHTCNEKDHREKTDFSRL
jgi:hypothetical protein